MIFRLFPVLMVLAIGCVATTTTTFNEEQREFEKGLRKAMKTWEGSHISQIVQRLDPPTYKAPDEAGGTIYVWRVDPASLPAAPPPATIISPSSRGTPLTQATSKLLYLQSIEKEKDRRYERARFRQRMLAMKQMFYVRPDGTIYLANLLFQ